MLIASVILSLNSGIFRHIRALEVEKGFLRFKQKIIIFMWTLSAATRRILSLVIYFTPSMGLYNILYHWKAETYPFKFRINSVKRLNITPFEDAKIELLNMTETIYWSELDRWDYSNPQHPKPPSYKLYTGMTLKETFATYLVIFTLHKLTLLLVKIMTSEDFAKKKNIFKKFIHLLENVNYPVPYKDWDQGSHSVAEFKQRFKNTEREMIWSFVVTMFYTAVMFLPLVCTGLHLSIIVFCLTLSVFQFITSP